MNVLPDSPENIVSGVNYFLVTHLCFDHFSPDYLPRDLRIMARIMKMQKRFGRWAGIYEDINMMKIDELLAYFDNGGAFGDDPEVVSSMVNFRTRAASLSEMKHS